MPLPKAPSKKGDRVLDAVPLSAKKLNELNKKASELIGKEARKKESPSISTPTIFDLTDDTSAIKTYSILEAKETSITPEEKHSTRTYSRGRALVSEDKKKLFVLDTNVLMHDPMSIFKFAEHDIFIPMTTLEELDANKKGLSDVARNARYVARTLDSLTEKSTASIESGIKLNLLGNTEATGTLYFETQATREKIFDCNKPDNTILETTASLTKAFPEHCAILVSKDINMRIKASILGIPVEDYFNDFVVEDPELLYTGHLELAENFWETVKDISIHNEKGVSYYHLEVDDVSRFKINMCLTIQNDNEFFGLVTKIDGSYITIKLLVNYCESGKDVLGIHARNKEQNLALNLLLDPNLDFVSLLGAAGTGKTLLALTAALAQTKTDRYKEVIVTRNTLVLGEDIGYLPGDEEEKMEPWMGAFEDNLEVISANENIKGKLTSKLSIKSLNFMRGRSFLRKFLIIDEAQNLSSKQIKTLISRAGHGTKVVCLGNLSQIDSPYLTEGSSGLAYAVERFMGWEHAATLTLTTGERSRLSIFANDNL